jgi:uncharacterized protein (UPF0332 family)
LPAELHQWLRDAADARKAGDYFNDRPVGRDEAATHIARAEEFLKQVTAYIAEQTKRGES